MGFGLLAQGEMERILSKAGAEYKTANFKFIFFYPESNYPVFTGITPIAKFRQRRVLTNSKFGL